MSNTRFNIAEVLPKGFNAMLAFSGYVQSSKLKPTHKHLINIRASQINGCAYCLDMHTKEARADGETEQRLYTLSAWRDTPFFTEEERAILALTEEITHISNRVSDETYEHAVQLLDKEYIAEVIIATVIINSWNRICVTTGRMPE
jgi:AhpD family alkylhydroperoxidase